MRLHQNRARAAAIGESGPQMDATDEHVEVTLRVPSGREGCVEWLHRGQSPAEVATILETAETLFTSAGQWKLGEASGKLETDPTSSWTQLAIVASGGNITAVVNGASFPAGRSDGHGMVSINSGFHVAYFDNFTVTAK